MCPGVKSLRNMGSLGEADEFEMLIGRLTDARTMVFGQIENRKRPDDGAVWLAYEALCQQTSLYLERLTWCVGRVGGVPLTDPTAGIDTSFWVDDVGGTRSMFAYHFTGLRHLQWWQERRRATGRGVAGFDRVYASNVASVERSDD